MPTLDLRHTGKLFIQVLATKTWNFELTAPAEAASLIGASATMVIKNTSIVQSLTIGAGLTITASNKLAVVPAPLALGIYDYVLEIVPLTGDSIRFIDKIDATNE